MEQADRILIQRLASSSSADAFADIMRQYTPLVYAAGWRLLQNDAQAADVVQETFFHLLKNARSIQGSLASWLHRVATRRAIDLIRQNTARRRREQSYAAQPPTIESEWSEIEPLIDQALDTLPDDLRTILIRHFLEGQTMAQIATAHGVSQPTISRRVAVGLEQLRESLRARGVIVAAVAIASVLSNTAQAVPATVLSSLGKLALANSAWSIPAPSTAIGTLPFGIGIKGTAALFLGVLAPVFWWTIQVGDTRDELLGRGDPSGTTAASAETVASLQPVSAPRLDTEGAIIDDKFSVGGSVFVSGGSASGSIAFSGGGVTWTNSATGGFALATNAWSGGLTAPSH